MKLVFQYIVLDFDIEIGARFFNKIAHFFGDGYMNIHGWESTLEPRTQH